MKSKQVIVFLIIALTSISFSEWTYPNCVPLTENDFVYELLVDRVEGAMRGKLPNPPLPGTDPSLIEPIDMAFDVVNGEVNFYYIERKGAIKYYDAALDEVTVLHSGHKLEEIGLSWYQNHGLVGIEPDPDFSTNRWMYLYYSHGEFSGKRSDPPNDTQGEFRISRFKAMPDHSLDLSSEKVILTIPMINRELVYHTGGDMEFDDYGNLWIAVGDNVFNKQFYSDDIPGSDSRRSAGSTKSLLGGIVRITPIKFPDNENPDPGPGLTYTVPSGNLGDYFANKYRTEGKESRALEFEDTSRVAPEIYAIGGRNPYTISLEPAKGWVTTGDCGPDPADRNMKSEEHHFLTRPSNMGWPYFTGPNIPYGMKVAVEELDDHGHDNFDPENIINNSPNNKGLTHLPPAEGPLHYYPAQCAVTGPIYRYDGSLVSSRKMPPHFNNVWFVTDYNSFPGGSWIKAIVVDETGTKIMKNETVFKNALIDRPLGLKEGPDGAFYVINYAGSYSAKPTTSIGRISYVGNCKPVGTISTMSTRNGFPAFTIKMAKGGLSIETDVNEYTLNVTDLNGREVFSAAGNGVESYPFPKLSNGVYFANVSSSGKKLFSQAVTFLNK